MKTEAPMPRMPSADDTTITEQSFPGDFDSTIQHASVNNLDVGRNPEESLRIPDGLQTDELCPCNRAMGGATL